MNEPKFDADDIGKIEFIPMPILSLDRHFINGKSSTRNIKYLTIDEIKKLYPDAKTPKVS
jgi:hypothetical protein